MLEYIGGDAIGKKYLEKNIDSDNPATQKNIKEKSQVFKACAKQKVSSSIYTYRN